MAVFRGCITLNDDSDMILVIETNAPQYGFATRIMRLLSRLQPTRTLDLQVRFNWNDEPPLEGKEQRLDRWEHIKSHLSGVCNLDTNKEIALFVGLGVCQEVTLRTDEERVSILRIGCQQPPGYLYPQYPDVILDEFPPNMALGMCHAVNAASAVLDKYRASMVLQSLFIVDWRGQHVMPLTGRDVVVIPPYPDDHVIPAARLVDLLMVVIQLLPGQHVIPLTGRDVVVIPPDPDINLDVHG